MRLSPAPVRSRTRGARTATGPRPVMIARSGRWPWRTSRWRPSSVCLSAWLLRKAATSASTACANSARAPSRRTSVSGSENAAGWISLTTVSWIMACRSFGGEVEVSNTPTIRRLIPHAVTNFRAYLVTAFVQPISGETFWSISNGVSKPFFAALLARFAREAGAGRDRILGLGLDSAGWRTAPNLAVPDGIRLTYLPPDSPELQPAEHLWPILDEPLANHYFATLADLEHVVTERCRVLNHDQLK